MKNNDKYTPNTKECKRSDVLKLTMCPAGSFKHMSKSMGFKPIRSRMINGTNTKFYNVELIRRMGSKYGWKVEKS